MRRDPVLDWLLEPSQPAMRYRTLRELLGRPAADPDVEEARRAIPRRGWAAEILAERSPEGWWGSGDDFYRPKYTSTNWRMLVLSDLGLAKEDPPIAASCDVWTARAVLRGGGVGGNSKGNGHHCFVGNMARALLRFGYIDDPRIRPTLDWLVETADPKGGWSCFGRGRNLDSWEGLSAFAAYPRSRWTRAMTDCVDRGTEFFLERELHRQGAEYPPWYRFHYPVHYYYDVLVGLDILTALGRGDDPRLGFALGLLADRRRPDGRWNLDAVHPDVDAGMARWFAAHPKDRPTPLALETAGAPSKMITLTALTVLSRVGAWSPPEGTPPG
ncbi:MAG TPA: hypothetical protein VMH78_02895 [Thermoplasmata archaeon]|nr:hypothetical protein [Thermoplasmata archaeon]